MSDENTDSLNAGLPPADPNADLSAPDAIDWRLRIASLEDSVIELNLRLIAAEDRIKSLTHPSKWPKPDQDA